MKRPSQPVHPRRGSSKRPAFALIVAISLMSMILLLMISLATFTQVELVTAATNEQMQRAQENARFGLLVALGKLNQAAGPDQRNTARAEILGDEVTGGARFWTGVWIPQTAGDHVSGDPIVWLVSGSQTPLEATNPVDGNGVATDDRHVVLVGPATVSPPDDGDPAEHFIAVEKVALDRGEFGFWVGDEGVKADASQFEDDYEEVSAPNFQTGAQKQGIAQQVGAFSIVDTFEDEDFSRFDPDIENLIEKAFSLYAPETLEIDEVPDLGETFKKHAHDFTPGAAFVLTNTLDGGLRQDLSHMKRVSPFASQADLAGLYDRPEWDLITPELVRYMQYHESAPDGAVLPDVPTNYMSEPLTFGTQPLAPEIAVMCGLGCRSTREGITDDIYLIFYIFADILNPYTRELRLDNGRGSWPGDPTDIDIKVKNLPEITITNRRTGRSQTMALPDIEGGINTYYDHTPGYMRPVSHPSGSYRNSVGGEGTIALSVGDFGATPRTWDPFEVSFDISNVKIELYEAKTNASTPRKFQEITLENWGDFSIDYDANAGNDETRFVRGGSAMNRSWLNADNWTFGFHLKYVDDWFEHSAREGNLQPLEDALGKGDFRKREITIDMLDPEAGDGVFFAVAPPDEVSRSNILIENDVFQGAWFGSDANNRIARLYDLPDQEPLSMGALNALIFPNGRPNPLGNYFDGEALGNLENLDADNDFDDPDESLNNFFDRYFFSGLPEEARDWDRETPLPNPRLSLTNPSVENEALESEDAAVHFLVQGGLNINSQSTEAWRALLQGRPIADFTYTTSSDQPRTINELERATFNHAFSPGNRIESGDAYRYLPPDESWRFARNLVPDGSHETFIQGFRALTADQANQIAQNLTALHREWTAARGRPFESLTEFINSGIFQRAIDDAETINAPGEYRIPVFSPAFVNAGSILGRHSNHLFARSDTFRIRAYGADINPFTGARSAEAYCEAIVQREPGGNPSNSTRKFKVVYFQWLTPSEI